MKIFSQINLIEFLLVTLVSIALLILYLFRTDLITLEHPNFNLPWDRHKYIEMAKTGLNFHIAPFCWRILIPFLSSILPFDLQTNFLLITSFFIVVTSILIYYFVKQIFKQKAFAWLGLLIYYSFGWIIKNSLSDFWLIDPGLFFFLVLALIFIYRDKDVELSITLLIGVLTKELIFYLLPFLLMHKMKSQKLLFAIKQCALIFLPALLVYFIITQLIPSRNQDIIYVDSISRNLSQVTIYGSEFNLRLFLTNIINEFDIFYFTRSILGTYGIFVGVFSFISLLHFPKNRIIYLLMILISWLPLFFTIINHQRLMIISFPFFIILTLQGIEKIFTKLNINIFFAFIFPLTLIITNLYHFERIFTSLQIQIVLVIISILIIIFYELFKKKQKKVP